MSAFNDEMAAADAAIFLGLGELASAKKTVSGLIVPDVSVIVDRDVDVYLGDVPSLSSTVSFRPSDLAGFGEGDTLALDSGEILQLVRRLSGDGGEVTWVVVHLPIP